MNTIDIHGYQKLETLYENQGTMVVRALDKHGEKCVLKMLKDRYPSEERLTQLEYEYNVLCRLDDKRISNVRELLKHYKGHIIVMENIEGIPLLDVPAFSKIRTGTKQLELYELMALIKIFIEMVKVIERFHEKNMIHKEINPKMFYVKDDFSQVSILDFGLSKRINAYIREMNKYDGIEEILPYVSPEQTGRMDRLIDYRTDFYSLGVSMYELATGQRPFITDNTLEMVHCHIAKTPVAPRVMNPAIPMPISSIILKLMEKEPDMRYQSASGIVHDLSKCLESLSAYGVMDNFEIGTNDRSHKFKIPQKLYGREREREILLKLYEQTIDGEVQVLLIGGLAGVGKTSIIQEVYRPRAERSGFFASGKAEQLQINTPYYAFSLAAKELIKMLLQEPEHILMQWKEQLQKQLDNNGQLIVELVPDLEKIIGIQPRVKELEPTENKNRFLNTFASFFKVFANREHPLIIFLDDLQWCDQSSIEFINYLLGIHDLDSFMVIGSFRDNEVLEENQLKQILNELQKSNNTTTITVKPLEEKTIANILLDTLHCDKDEIQSLTKVIHKKTEGNPFFVRSLLNHLYMNHFFVYNEKLHQWEWNDDEIQNISVSDNIVDFMIHQIKKLPHRTQSLLKAAALVGTSFDLEILSKVEKMDALETAMSLKEAVENEIIIPESDYYDVVSMLGIKDVNLRFAFAHDRVQQACAALMEEMDKKQLHLAIGRIMKQNVPEEELKDHSIYIAMHLNEGLERIKDIEERWDVAKLNLWACQKTKASSSFRLSLQYITSSMRMLPEDAWEQDYTLTFEIIKAYAECAYLNNEYILAETQIKILMEHAKDAIDQAEIRLMQSILYRFLGQFDNVIKYGILGLRLLGIRLPAKPGFDYVIKELIAVKARLLGKSTDVLLNYKLINDEKIKLIIRIMAEINSVAYPSGNANLFLASTLKSLNLMLRYGNSREAASVYSAYAILLAVLGDFKGSYNFNHLALQLVEAEERAQYRAGILFAYGFIGQTWNESWQGVDYWIKKAMEEAIRYGDHYQTALAGAFMYSFKADMNLKLLIEKAMEQLPVIKQTNNRFGYYTFYLFINRYLNYAGLTDGKYMLDVSQKTFEQNGNVGAIDSEEECLRYLKQINSLSVQGVYYKEKMYIHYFYDDYAAAMQYLKESDKYKKQHLGTPYIVECSMCSFLVLTANITELGMKSTSKVRRRLHKEYKHMKAWAAHCEVNFKHLQYIMEAELARIDKHIFKATKLYELAIKTAANNGFIRDEALANELAAKMFLSNGMNKLAVLYMTEAYSGYKRWGADAKTKLILERYGEILNISDRADIAFKADGIIDLKDIDLMSIMSAYRTVATEVQLPDLLRKIMKLVAENSGAQKAYILLKYEQGWNMEAEWLQGQDTKLMNSVPLEEARDILPISVVHYCVRSGEYVLLGDASNMRRFYKDSYIQKNQTKSLLCMPITNQGNMTGILYLENNLTTDVFANEHVQVLQLLAAQFSISIKNVQLFSNLITTTEELHHSVEKSLRSDIAFLQAQIKPHFLYNAINTISAFSLDDPKMTRELLASLSDYLRGSFDFKNRDQLVAFSREIELVKAYLFIEKARYGERLQVVFDLDDSIDCMLPPLVIQPLVENSVHHGLANQKNGGTVKISAHMDEASVIITVEDDGAGIPEAILEKLLDDTEGKSVALKNIHMRLVRLYGHGLVIKSRIGGGTQMILQIPMEGVDPSLPKTIFSENAYLYDSLKGLIDEKTIELREEIIERKKTEKALLEIANHDPLTKLPSRRKLNEILEQAVKTAKQNEKIIGVLFVDLDGFKEINDNYGHDKGDLVLINIADRFSEAVRGGDTVARLGGDEFVVILQNVTNITEIRKICTRICALLGKPIMLDEAGTEAKVASSIGISIFPEDGETVEELISNADKAMYIAKEKGKNQFVFYSQEYDF